jgi:hypothetical protein
MYLGKAKPFGNEIHYAETSKSEKIAKEYISNLNFITYKKKINP